MQCKRDYIFPLILSREGKTNMITFHLLYSVYRPNNIELIYLVSVSWILLYDKRLYAVAIFFILSIIYLYAH